GQGRVGRGSTGEALEVPEVGARRPLVHGVRRPELLLSVGAQLVVGARRAEMELADTVPAREDAEAVPGAQDPDRERLSPGRRGTQPARAVEVVHRRGQPDASSVEIPTQVEDDGAVATNLTRDVRPGAAEPDSLRRSIEVHHESVVLEGDTEDERP